MDKEKNILLAKKYMVESIYRSANIEGVGVTFPETQTICDGICFVISVSCRPLTTEIKELQHSSPICI